MSALKVFPWFVAALLLPAFAFHLGAQAPARHLESVLDTTVNYGAFHFFQLRFHRGSNATSSKNETVADIFQSSAYNGLDFRLGWQTTGEKAWQRLLRYPTYGVGIASYLYSVEDVSNLIGEPSGIYGFIGIPLYRGPGFKFHSDLDLSAGLTYDLNPYDEITNPYNDAVGSRILFYFDFDLSFTHWLSKRLDLTYGLSLIHFSNGRSRTPNLGVNMVGLHLGMRYHFNALQPFTRKVLPDRPLAWRPTFIRDPVPKFKGYWISKLWTSVGTAASNPAPEDDQGNPQSLAGPNYFTSSTGVELQRRYGGLGSVGLGISYMFDASLADNYETGEPSVWQRSLVSIGPLHEFFFNRLAIFTQFGVYLHVTEEAKTSRGGWHLRAGGRIYLGEQSFIHAALKTRNGGIADWVEFGFGMGWPFGRR